LLGLAVGLAAEERQARTFVLKVDDAEHEITTGQDLVVACRHAEGKSHRLAASESAVQRFAKRGLQFAYPSECSCTWDAQPEHLAVRVRHPDGPIVRITVMPGEGVPGDALERHALSMRQHLRDGGAEEVKESEIVSTLGGVLLPGRQVTCIMLGEKRATEVYYHRKDGRAYAVTLDYDVMDAETAQKVFSALASSLRFE